MNRCPHVLALIAGLSLLSSCAPSPIALTPTLPVGAPAAKTDSKPVAAATLDTPDLTMSLPAGWTVEYDGIVAGKAYTAGFSQILIVQRSEVPPDGIELWQGREKDYAEMMISAGVLGQKVGDVARNGSNADDDPTYPVDKGVVGGQPGFTAAFTFKKANGAIRKGNAAFVRHGRTDYILTILDSTGNDPKSAFDGILATLKWK